MTTSESLSYASLGQNQSKQQRYSTCKNTLESQLKWTCKKG